MPILKHVLIHNTVDQSLEYILNDDKTEKGVLTASLNCMTNAQDAFLEMKMIYEHYTGRSYNEPIPEQGNAHVKAIHYIQSFAPDDNVTPELAHRIAKAFVRKAFGDNVQAVIATHTDKAHLHSHIIINSVDIEGNHFYANKNSLRKLRDISDEVAKAFGIFPNKNLIGTGHSIEYNEWEHKKKGTSWKEQIRNEIDRLIPLSLSLDDLLSMLEDRGYEIKRGKYISVKAPGQQRFIRTKTLGEEYTEDSLNIRILYREVGAGSSLTENSRSALRAAYVAIIGDVRILAEQNKKIQRKQDTMLPYSADNDLDIYKLSAQLSIINQDKISSIGDLDGRISNLRTQYEKEREETNRYIEQHNNMVALLEQAQMYFELSAKGELSASDEMKMTIYKKSMDINDIHSPADVERLRDRTENSGKKITALKDNLESCQQRFDVYSDISKTYFEISKGDYIEKLALEEKRRRDQETKRHRKKL